MNDHRWQLVGAICYNFNLSLKEAWMLTVEETLFYYHWLLWYNGEYKNDSKTQYTDWRTFDALFGPDGKLR